MYRDNRNYDDFALQHLKSLSSVDVSSESYWSLSSLYGQVYMRALLCTLMWCLQSGDTVSFFSCTQFTYGISKVQLKMLQITSRSAQQKLTIRCRNIALSNKLPTFKGFSRKTDLTPTVMSNGCKVGREGERCIQC